MTLPILDRYLLREWSKIFFITMVAFPLFAIIIELTDKLDEYLAKGIEPSAITLSYVFSLPEKLSLTLPAAVLFATAQDFCCGCACGSQAGPRVGRGSRRGAGHGSGGANKPGRCRTNRLRRAGSGLDADDGPPSNRAA